MKRKSYLLKKPRFNYSAGCRVYEYWGCTYGMTSDDERAAFGEAHIAVTESPSGELPFFTVPVSYLREWEEREAPK